MGRNHQNLKYQLCQAALKGLKDNQTVTGYKRDIKRFAVWCRENTDIKDIDEISTDVIQRYEESLESDARDYTPATIHKLLAPVCRATGASMREIRKPKRTAGTIIRGRNPDSNSQGKHQEAEERFSRLVDLQHAVGIRRAELAHLTGKDFDGTYVIVTRGKGGKRQKQLILPDDRATVRRIFAGVAPDQPVFSHDEMQNVIDLHGIRAQHARDCYAYYAKWFHNHPEKAAAVRSSLLYRWESAHSRLKFSNPAAYTRQRSKFIRDTDSRSYELRGENRAKALNSGKSVTYNRLALMCVSVLHLSHWRLDVTVVNYLV